MLKRNLFFLFSLTAFAIASTVLDVFNYNPYEPNRSVFINFYVSLFLSLVGILALTIYYVKYKQHKGTIIHSYFWPSVRQASFLSAGLIAMLVLKGFSLLDWWISLAILAVVVLLELFFQTKRIEKNT